MVTRPCDRQRWCAARRLSDRARHRDFQAPGPLPLSAERLHPCFCRRQREGARRIGSICCRASRISISSRPLQQRQNADANYRPLIYQLDERGSRILAGPRPAVSFQKPSSQLRARVDGRADHRFYRAGYEGKRDIRLISWPDILANERTPLATRLSSTPAAIRVSYSLRGEQRHDDIYADAKPFGLERTIDGRRAICSSPASRPIARPSRSTPAICAARRSLRSLLPISPIAEQGIHRSHFGFPNFFVPFITTTTPACAR